MIHKNAILAAATLCAFSGTATAQTTTPAEPAAQATESSAQSTAPAPSVCMTDENFRAFDFWVGDWNVSGNNGGPFAGTNSITVIEGGCALLETWKGQGGSTGISTNHYNPNTGKWRQLWLSAGAYSIDYEGGIINGSMAMEGLIYYYGNDKTFPFRGRWTPLPDGSVRQHFEQFNPEKDEWVTWFDGIYTRNARLVD